MQTLQPFKTVERSIRVSNWIRASRSVLVPREVISPVLRQAAGRIRTIGFTVYFGTTEGPACFMGSIHYAIINMHGGWKPNLRNTATDFVQRLIFDAGSGAFDKDSLKIQGWTARDAAAALDMAADYAEAIGR